MTVPSPKRCLPLVAKSYLRDDSRTEDLVAKPLRLPDSVYQTINYCDGYSTLMVISYRLHSLFLTQ